MCFNDKIYVSFTVLIKTCFRTWYHVLNSCELIEIVNPISLTSPPIEILTLKFYTDGCDWIGLQWLRIRNILFQ